MLALALTGKWHSRTRAAAGNTGVCPRAWCASFSLCSGKHLVGSGKAPCPVLQAWSTVGSGSTPLGRGVGASLHPSSSAANAPYREGSVN